jgi:hypothetical protein
MPLPEATAPPALVIGVHIVNQIADCKIALSADNPAGQSV